MGLGWFGIFSNNADEMKGLDFDKLIIESFGCKTGIYFCQECSLNARAFFVDGIEQRIRHILDTLDYTIVQTKRLDDGI